MTKVMKPNVIDGELELDEILFTPPINEEFNRVIAYLYGLDNSNNKFRFLNLDENGNLDITLSQAVSTTITNTRPTITTSATIILSSNSARNKIRIRNVGNSTVFIGETSSVSLANGYPLIPGAEYPRDNYTGTLHGIADSSSSDLAVEEFT